VGMKEALQDLLDSGEPMKYRDLVRGALDRIIELERNLDNHAVPRYIDLAGKFVASFLAQGYTAQTACEKGLECADILVKKGVARL
jgi:hypothetical protein